MRLATQATAKEPKNFEKGKLLAIEGQSVNRGAVAMPGAVVIAVPIVSTVYDISVQIDDLIYVGQYIAPNKNSYQPGDLTVNDPIEVRFEKDKMILKRPNGKELETKLMKKTRVTKDPQE